MPGLLVDKQQISVQDLEVWKARQAELNQRGAGLTVDGVPGPSTVSALRAAGRRDGIWALG